MGKGVKIALLVTVPLVLAVGVAYGLAKFKILKLPQTAAMKPVWKAIGLPVATPGPTLEAAKSAAPPPDPLADQKKALAAQQKALATERTAWEDQKKAQQRSEERARLAAVNAAPDPKNVARMASVYEQMPLPSVSRIFSMLPDNQVLGLLRLMEEKKVAQILAAEKPDRAARLTLALSRPTSPILERTASNTP